MDVLVDGQKMYHGRKLKATRLMACSGDLRPELCRPAPAWLDPWGKCMERHSIMKHVLDSAAPVELLAGVPTLLWTADEEGHCTFVNRSWQNFTGRPAEVEQGAGWLEGIHPGDRDRWSHAYASALRERVPFAAEYRLRRHDGQYRWMMCQGSPHTTATGEFAGFIGSCYDVTSRRRTEDRHRFLLRASEELSFSLDYEHTLRSVARLAVPHVADWCAIDLRDEGGSLRRVAVEHTDPEKVRWAHELQRRYPQDPKSESGVARAVRTGRSELHTDVTDETLQTVAQDAEHLALLRSLGFRSVIIVPLKSSRGDSLGAITFVTSESGRVFDRDDLALAEDLSRRAGNAIVNARLFRELELAHRELQEQSVELEAQAADLEESAAELEMANAELETRSREAEEASRTKSEFLAVMSHELRTPLNAIAGYTELLEMGIYGPLAEKQRQSLRRIRSSQEQLLAIINDVLSYARLGAGRIKAEPGPVSLTPVLEQQCAAAEARADSRTLELEPCAGEEDVVVFADEHHLGQILGNLLANAIKFTPPEGDIRVSCSGDEGEVRVAVTDTGVGIARHRLEAIFDPFVQVEAGLTRMATGVGLGLAISRNLARLVGGDVSVESQVGRGSTFTLTLRRAGRGEFPP